MFNALKYKILFLYLALYVFFSMIWVIFSLFQTDQTQ